MPPEFDAKNTRSTLFTELVKQAKRHGTNTAAVEDNDGQVLSYGRLVLGARILGRKIDALAAPGEQIGVLLPNAAGMVVTIFGLNAVGRTAGLLNFTAGPRNLAAAIQTGPLPVVLTSRRFIKLANLEALIEDLEKVDVRPGERVKIHYLEDVRSNIGLTDKLSAIATSPFALRSHQRTGMQPDDIAVILFTSGTEGTPKGVALTNANLIANARQIFQHADGMLTSTDIVLNPLPMFHSFGLTAATLMPLLNGLKVALYPSPLHYKEIPKFIKKTKASIVFATDTFLQGYGRTADDADLTSVRFVIAGAERVKDTTRARWRQAGVEILEGYGATECAPVIACNLPDAARAGSVGKVLPAIDMRVEPVPGISDGGRLFVRGPNVMAGYIFKDAPGNVVPTEDGWHDTGDIVTVSDGFVTISGRAKRFAKIGGEMVSLAAIETVIADLWPEHNHVVVNIADPRKGEQLVVVTSHPDADRGAIGAHLKAEGLPELWVPKTVLVVDEIPVLGTGKVDFAATHALVAARHAQT